MNKVVVGGFFIAMVLFGFGFRFTESTNAFPFLNQGTTIQFEVYSKNTVLDYPKIHIDSVYWKKNKALISAQSIQFYSSTGKQVMNPLHYQYDSLNFYASAANWFVKKMDGYYTIGGLVGDSVVYPFHMKVGDSLATAWANCKLDADGYEEAWEYKFAKRYVAKQDTITSPVGKFFAYRIEGIIHATMTMSGPSGKLEPGSFDIPFTEWFDPSTGIVADNYTDKDAGTSTSSNLMAISKR